MVPAVIWNAVACWCATADRAAERGVGASMMPVPPGDKWLESGRQVALFDQELVTDVSYCLVGAPRRAEDPGVWALRDWILQTFSEH